MGGIDGVNLNNNNNTATKTQGAGGVDYFQRLPQAKGVFTTDEDGNVVHTSADGIKNYASEAGLQNETIMRLMQLAQATGDYELMNILAESDKLPSSTRKDISSNEYQTNQFDMGNRLIGDQEKQLRSDYGYKTDQNEMGSRLIGAQENSLRSGFNLDSLSNIGQMLAMPSWLKSTTSGMDLATSKNRMNMGLVDREGGAIGSGYDYTKAINDMQTGLVGNQGAALKSGYDLQKGQNESGLRLTPYQEDASREDLQYKADASRGARALMPSRISATQKFLNASQQGLDTEAAANRAGVDVTSAFKDAEEANARNMARMGVAPGSGAYKDNSIQKALAVTQAKNVARQNADNENYRRLGAVALMP